VAHRKSELTLEALLVLADRSSGRSVEELAPFTPHFEANLKVMSNPLAFLTAVIFDQGIPAERAWNAPFMLKIRLGHFDVRRIADEEQRVREAIQQPPMLHRIKENMPRWITNAARRVVEEYGGDASRIWSDAPTAIERQRRFAEFQGIGQKKAAMAVELLEQHFKIEVRQLAGSNIAYDVHVRRVLLRTGLANQDDRRDMVDAARLLHPERTGSLDFPLWDIGRRWCRPQRPNCDECPLGDHCPRLLDRSAGVRGV